MNESAFAEYGRLQLRCARVCPFGHAAKDVTCLFALV